MDTGEAGFVTRLLVLDEHRDWRLILTETFDPRRGLDTTEILDDTSGWWVRLEHRYEMQAATMETFFRHAQDLPSIDEATRILDYRLSTRDGVTFAPRIPAKGATASVIWDDLFEQLSTVGVGHEIAAGVPDRFREAVLFLDASLMDWGSVLPSGVADRPRDWPGLLGLLARVLRDSVPSDDPRFAEFAAPWPMTVGASGKGSTIVEPELLELTSHFSSVENADPLAGHRVDDLAGRAADP